MLTTHQRSPNLAPLHPSLPCQNVTLEASTVLQTGNWVNLWVMPSEFAHDTALLLCAMAIDHWVVWIPDHGEAELCLRQICPIP